jgi:hypothetical protein
MSHERESIKRKYKSLFERVSRLLFEIDPIGINFGSNKDEYDPEVGTILPRLESARSQDDVKTIVQEEFHRWFELDTSATPEHFDAMSKGIWEEWLRFKEQRQ